MRKHRKSSLGRLAVYLIYDFLILVGYLDSQSKSSSKLISPFRNFLYSLNKSRILPGYSLLFRLV